MLINNFHFKVSNFVLQLRPNLGKWREAKNELALCVIPILAPVPFGKRIESTIFDESFVDEMEKLSEEHGFWARIMNLAIKQADTESDLTTIVKRMLNAKTSTNCDPCCAATKGFLQNIHPLLSSFHQNLHGWT
jgi:hypothetical protein